MKRDEYIIIKLTTQEKEIIKTKAKEEGLTVSSYARHVLIK